MKRKIQKKLGAMGLLKKQSTSNIHTKIHRPLYDVDTTKSDSIPKSTWSPYSFPHELEPNPNKRGQQYSMRFVNSSDHKQAIAKEKWSYV